jgi:hypothetical protein
MGEYHAPLSKSAISRNAQSGRGAFSGRLDLEQTLELTSIEKKNSTKEVGSGHS